MTSAARLPRQTGAVMLTRAAGTGAPGGGSVRVRPLSAIAEFVKTFVDRTLDVARGRYDM
jgi:hypothetical protein